MFNLSFTLSCNLSFKTKQNKTQHSNKTNKKQQRDSPLSLQILPINLKIPLKSALPEAIDLGQCKMKCMQMFCYQEMV